MTLQSQITGNVNSAEKKQMHPLAKKVQSTEFNSEKERELFHSTDLTRLSVAYTELNIK